MMLRMLSPPDPVDDAAGYQRFVLERLGQDDPAEVQASSSGAWRALDAVRG